jgi:hypothetical protein
MLWRGLCSGMAVSGEVYQTLRPAFLFGFFLSSGKGRAMFCIRFRAKPLISDV